MPKATQPDFYIFTLRKKRDEGGDYVVRCWKNGKRHPDGDSFDPDWQASVDTLNAQRRWAEQQATGGQLVS